MQLVVYYKYIESQRHRPAKLRATQAGYPRCDARLSVSLPLFLLPSLPPSLCLSLRRSLSHPCMSIQPNTCRPILMPLFQPQVR